MLGQDREDLDELKGRQSQRGSGRHTLCCACNSKTGNWYVPYYLEWIWYAVRVLSLTGGRQSSLHLPFRIFPLRVLKQIVSMFLASTDIAFRDAREDLVRFVLDRERKGMDPEICIYAFLNPSPRARSTGIATIGTFGDGGASAKVVNEIALRPVGYLMTLGSASPDERLVDITFFAKYSHNDWKEFWLTLPVLPVYAPFPADYRTRDEVLEAGRRGREYMRRKAATRGDETEHA